MYTIINKYYPGEELVNYHQKRVRVNYQYFVVMEDRSFPFYAGKASQFFSWIIFINDCIHILNGSPGSRL